MSTSPRISRNTNGDFDLVFENGKFKWATDGTQAAQHALIRLLAFKGEYSLNSELGGKDSLGTDWYGIVFDMSKSKAEKELEIKRRILGTDGVEKITDWSWTQSGHSVTITGIVVTQWGSVDISQTIEAL